MGGRAFKNLVRITRDDIPKTLEFLAGVINLPYDYMMANMMGSCMKQADSGDIDVCVDSGMFSESDFEKLADDATSHFGENNVIARFNNGQINMSIPIPNTCDNVQVDLIYGNAEWLKFSHWSPGDSSKWKGVFISQTLAVLAKSKVLYVYPSNAVVDKDAGVDTRLGEVSLRYNLEYGVHVQCRMAARGSFVRVSDDEFESKCPGPMPPHVPRYGFITEPDAVLKMLVGKNATLDNTDTFEKLLSTIKHHMTDDEWNTFVARLTNSMSRTGAKHYYKSDDLDNLLTSVV